MPLPPALRALPALLAAFCLGLCAQPGIAAALQEIRLEPGSAATVTAGVETQVSCAGSAVPANLPACVVEKIGTRYKISYKTGEYTSSIPEWTDSLEQTATVVAQMSAAHLCR